MRPGKSFLLILLLGSHFIFGQNKQVLYDFTDIPQALLLNPGMQTDFQWYAGIPALSGISFQAGSSGITVDDLFAADGVDFTQKVRDKAVFGLTKRDELSGTMQIDLLNGGFRSRKNPTDFYSFGMYLEGDGIGYWPRDLAILPFEGNANRLGERFQLGHLKMRGDLVNVVHFGINRQLGNGWTVGARGKIYSGIMHFSSTSNKGYFLTTEGQDNLLANSIDADMRLQTSGFEEIRNILDDDTLDQASEIVSTMTKRALFGGNLGLGIDLGFTYDLNDQWLLTGSVLDLGFIYHTRDIRTFTLNGQATIEGVEVILPDALADPDPDFWEDLVDEVEALVPFDDNDSSYLKFRPTKLYGSVRYNFGEPMGSRTYCDCDISTTSNRSRIQYANSLGGQIYAINRPRGPQTALSVFYLRRFGEVLGIKGTYTVDKFSQTNIGLGMNVQAGPVNFYLMADNLLSYRNIADSHYASFQIGLNIISWGDN